MLKTGLWFLFGTFTQFIAVIIFYEFFFRYAQLNGGVNCIYPMEMINPAIWCIVVTEAVISICMIAAGLRSELKKANSELPKIQVSNH